MAPVTEGSFLVTFSGASLSSRSISYLHASDHVPKPGVPDQPLRRPKLYLRLVAPNSVKFQEMKMQERVSLEYEVQGPGSLRLGVHSTPVETREVGKKVEQRGETEEQRSCRGSRRQASLELSD